MKKILLFAMMLLSVTSMQALDIVKKGKAQAVVVLPNNATFLQSTAAEDFAKRVEVSSGAKIAVVKQSEVKGVAKSLSKIYVVSECPDGAPLKAEEYRIVAKGGDLYICGEDLKNGDERISSRVTMWAFSHIMEKYMDVVWLWPGELGTVTPKMETITVPSDIDYSYQTPLTRRKFSILHGVNEDLLAWCARNQAAGQRTKDLFQHSFRKKMSNGDWWGKFYESDPDMLAQSPNGKPELQRKADFYKICVSNPKSVDEVVRCWKAAGSPDFWDITPNDGNGFCTCDDCQALDLKYNGVKYTKDEIWNKKRDDILLSGRYAWFWNQVIKRMRQTNPNVEVGVFLYSAYRTPPKNLKLEKGIVGEMCAGFDFENWQNWVDAGVSGVALRPNWLYMGACAPHLALEKAGSYIEKARVNSMRHAFMDAMHEFWGTQGVYYYMVARLLGNYDMSAQDCIDEYCHAFGDAEPYIREYIEYWERYSNDEVLFNIPAGGSMPQDPNGLYETTSRKVFGSVLHPLQGHWRIMPYIYTADVQSKARAILDKAQAATDDELTKERIDFLREGLNMVNVVGKFVTVDLNDKAKQREKLQDIADYGNYLYKKFGYWGRTEIPMMQRFHVADADINLDDM